MRQALSRESLLSRHCRPLHDQPPCTAAEIQAQLALLPGWELQGDTIERSFGFRDYHDTLAFVNALAWMVHAQDHHPELVVGYNRCLVRWNTHSVGGVSENDFICAARCDALFSRGD